MGMGLEMVRYNTNMGAGTIGRGGGEYLEK